MAGMIRASAEEWLEALDGVAYLVASGGEILAVGGARWRAFAGSPGAQGPSPETVIGRSLFDFVDGDEAKAAFLAIHRRVAGLARPHLTYEYRCDAPGEERLMRMSVSALLARGRLQGVLYQSVLLASKDRVPLEYLSDSAALREERRLLGLPFVRICLFCARVTMSAWDGEWAEPHDYYRRGGAGEARLSHGVCPDCDRTRLAPLLG